MVSLGAALKRKKLDDNDLPTLENIACEAKSNLMVSLEAALKRKKRDDNEVDEKDTSPSCKLPLDLIHEIMTRLPAKSVFKFRCVSKMWSSITRTPHFIDSHYAMSSAARSRFAIVLSNNSVIDKRLFIFSSSYEEEKSSSLVTNLDLVIPSLSLSPGFSYCASLHSFIGCSGPFLVCNPAIKNFTTFPGNGQCTWFGYDPVGGHVKALTVECKPDDDFLVHGFFSLGLGGGESCNKFVSPPYYPATSKICIGGFLYHGAWTATPNQNPVVVCFDLRYEKISFIKAPALSWERAILIDYKGKLASIARNFHPYHFSTSFDKFDLWILEDAEKHDWSKQTFELSYSLGKCNDMTSPGTNKAGEIIFAPNSLSPDAQPFYIFYYNVQRKDLRRVRLLGIADDQEFRQVNGISEPCRVCIFPQHVEIVAPL